MLFTARKKMNLAISLFQPLDCCAIRICGGYHGSYGRDFVKILYLCY